MPMKKRAPGKLAEDRDAKIETCKNKRIVHLCIAHVQSVKGTTREAQRQWGNGERRSQAIDAATMHALRSRDAQRPCKQLH
jgi:hypothetical protein